MQRVTPLVAVAHGAIGGTGAAAAAAAARTVVEAVGIAAEAIGSGGAVNELMAAAAAAGVEMATGVVVATAPVGVAVAALLVAHVPYLHVAGSPPCLHLPPLLSYNALTSVFGAGLVSVGPHGAVPEEDANLDEVASPLVGPAPTKVTGDGLESLQMNEFDLRRPVV